MLGQCLRACIVADYRATWNELLSAPADNHASPSGDMQDRKLKRLSKVAHGGLLMEAEASTNPQYLNDLSSVPGLVEQLEQRNLHSVDWMAHVSGKSLYRPSTDKYKLFCREVPMTVFVGDGVYDGEGVQFPGLDFTLFAKHLVSADHRIWDGKQNMEGLSFIDTEDFYDALETGTEDKA